ncbi:MAG: transglutaminase family protein [Hyphomicrobiales bacterium]|nr:transglutaminase family protein [Hyphomicrobiales bacterium]
MQRLSVRHTTVYRYRTPVFFEPHRLMLRPRDGHDLRVLRATLTITPHAELRYVFDAFGNSVAVATFDAPSDTLSIVSELEIDRYPLTDIGLEIEPYAQRLPFSYPRSEVPDLGRTMRPHYHDPDRVAIGWARRWIGNDGRIGGTRSFLEKLTSGIRDELTYTVRDEPGVQTPLETLQKGSGTCRDFAVLMMEIVRAYGMAARFVSGYLYDPSLDGGAETIGAGYTHAWVQIYLPGAGWVEFDPTNGTYGGRNLIPVAVAREPEQAVPVAGTFRGDAADFSAMEVSVEVRSRLWSD